MNRLALTAREIEIMWLVVDGLTNQQIAKRLCLSRHTIKFHVFNALTKLNSKTRTDGAVMFALANVERARARFEKKLALFGEALRCDDEPEGADTDEGAGGQLPGQESGRHAS